MPENPTEDPAQSAPPGSEREDGWAEHTATSMGGVSITTYRNGVVKRAYPGGSVTFTFPDGRAAQFHFGDQLPYPPPPGVVVPLVLAPRRPLLRSAVSTIVRGLLFGIAIYAIYLASTIVF